MKLPFPQHLVRMKPNAVLPPSGYAYSLICSASVPFVRVVVLETIMFTVSSQKRVSSLSSLFDMDVIPADITGSATSWGELNPPRMH